MTKIQALPLEIVNLIAAGEVIDSLGAVVRELIENSLDAGADRLGINIFPESLKVRVSDNGKGMTIEDLRLCAKAHHTSKILQREDLGNIQTLGFRGEALHSITQMAFLEIFSYAPTAPDAVGWRVSYDQGIPLEEEAVAIAPGTIVNVCELFKNYPVRKNNLPKISHQLKNIQGIVHNTALCHPEITWRLWKNDTPWFNMSPSGSPKNIFPQILTNIQGTDLQELKVNLSHENAPNSTLELTLGLPDRCDRSRPDWVKIAVNGRMVRYTELEQTLLNAMSRTLRRDRYPVAFLHLKTPPDQVDWNRHPAKTEIYLQNLPFWQEQITIAVEKALCISPITLSNTFNNQRVGKLLKTAEDKATYNINANSKGDKPQKNNVSLIPLTAIAQVRNTYIVAEYPDGLWLVEQHIASERVIYEKLQDDWQIIEIDNPIIVQDLKSKQIEQLEKIGIKIESFGKNLWKIMSIPQILREREDQKEALIEISWGGDLDTAQVATACRTAIRNGTPLTLPQMQTLLDQWKTTRNPRTCPHGRPIYLSLEESALSRFFRRHWVIGKSHGI
jgi:DNA mismatch repair protein MutL